MWKFLASVLLWLCALTSAYAQNTIQLPIAAQAVADIGNGPIKVRVVQGNASVFTSQGSGIGSTSGSSTALTLTTIPSTPPTVGGLISGSGIASGTTVAAYNGTTGITLSAAMTVAASTPVAWGAACPSTPPSQSVQASVSADYLLLYTQARVCAISPGGPANTLLILPVFYDQTSPAVTVSLPVVAGNYACFLNTSGSLKDCGTSPASPVTGYINQNLTQIVSGALVPFAAFQNSLSGNPTSSSNLYTNIFSTIDNMDATGSLGGLGINLAQNDVLGTSAKGGRYGFQSVIALPVTTADGRAPDIFYQALYGVVSVSANQGGTDSTHLSRQYIAGIDEVYLNAGATFVNTAVSHATGLIMVPGASVGYTHGIQIDITDSGATRFSAASAIALQTGAGLIGWDYGINLSALPGAGFPFKSTATLISGGDNGASKSAALGVDFSGVTFSTGAFKSNNFLVDPSGIVTSPELNAPAATNLLLNAPSGQFVVFGINNSNVFSLNATQASPSVDNAMAWGVVGNALGSVVSYNYVIRGSGAGSTSLGSLNAGGSGFNINFPAANGTVALTSGANVASVSNSDSTLTISPTTGAVIASLNLGHANSWTALQTHSGAGVAYSGAISQTAWLTTGLIRQHAAATLTDTTSSGTVAAAYTNSFGGNTIAASSATTYTRYVGANFTTPTAGTNVTMTSAIALAADNLSIGGAAIGSDAVAITGTINVSNTIKGANLQAGAAGAFSWLGRTVVFSPSNGDMVISLNTGSAGARLGVSSTDGLLTLGTEAGAAGNALGSLNLANLTATAAISGASLASTSGGASIGGTTGGVALDILGGPIRMKSANTQNFNDVSNSNSFALGYVSNAFQWTQNGGARLFSITESGNVVVGSGAIATTATDGFWYAQTSAGPPTGVPTTITGRVALDYDTTTHQLWVYDGGWKQPKTPAGAATVTWQ